ncbi:YdbL family protein [Hyphococcus flavus]|uniref:YdbL family protein n=1 Tax=Hyphococcus flavus TaxID=1866326 RepID=A0AAE9ZF72_9PROT|nr:YdbL family protein [Hyphococcus flavus]WDI31773.1 YdbL family protein [Hyphococcus flavus]
MKKRIFSSAAAAMLLAASLSPVSAASAIVERAKDDCIVGEQADGYIGVVTGKNASSELRREIADINQQRKAVYADIARRNGVTIDVAAALTAEKLLNQASRGQCIRDQSGNWREV